jgi:NAD(P)-dependent dehydrogenase (short-subunit alcohol dehydrogenase family)
MKLNGSTALVTGGAVRIGEGITRALSQSGCSVVIHYRSSRKEAVKLTEKLQGPACTVGGSLDSEQGCVDLFGKAVEKAGPIDILVNNAAVYDRGPFSSLKEEKLALHLRTNLVAPLLLCREFARQDFGKRSGCTTCIVNILDTRIAGHDTGCLSYLVSKKALADITLDLAVELAPSVRVNGIAPGDILEPSSGKTADGKGRPGSVLPHDCNVSDVADAVLFAARSDYLTGQVIYVDSGAHLAAGGKVNIYGSDTYKRS